MIVVPGLLPEGIVHDALKIHFAPDEITRPRRQVLQPIRPEFRHATLLICACDGNRHLPARSGLANVIS
jgi:hypothetical protein